MGKVKNSPASLTKAVDMVRMNAPSRKVPREAGASFFSVEPSFPSVYGNPRIL